MHLRAVIIPGIVFVTALTMTACSGGGKDLPTDAPKRPFVGIEGHPNRLVIRWLLTTDATHHKLFENADGNSGFTLVSADIPNYILGSPVDISVHLYDFVNALYMVQACNEVGCTNSREISPSEAMLETIAYIKATNTEENDQFAGAMALSDDGSTLAVGSLDDSSATGINGDHDDNSSDRSGSVFIYHFDGVAWSPESYIKASNSDSNDHFGTSIALNADGTTLAVGSLDDSMATGVNGDEGDNSAEGAGAVYVFRFDGGDWFQQAYIKASNTEAGDRFGSSVSLSADGNSLVAGARLEDGSDSGINSDQHDNLASDSGAAYLFRFNGQDWIQEAYIKASNTDVGNQFGSAVSLSDSGNVLVIGAVDERGTSTGINGDQNSGSPVGIGAAYVFRFDGTDWSQEAYVKPSNFQPSSSGGGLEFGRSIDVSGDGNLFVAGAALESSATTGINGGQSGGTTEASGAAYSFRFDGTAWFQDAWFKASNTGYEDTFGSAVALSADGFLMAVAAPAEDGSAAGVGGDDTDDSAEDSGAVFLFRFDGTNWSQRTYVKAANTETGDRFGSAVALSLDGRRMVVGAPGEDSNATEPSNVQADNTALDSGAVYIY